MISDVVTVAWRAVGSPDVQPAKHARGICARCGEEGGLTPTRQVVSRNFTGNEQWRHPWRDGLCQACSWAYRAPLLRTLPHLIVRFPELLMPLTSAELATVLSRPLTGHSAVVVPLRPGRKHVVSGAAWGNIVTDDALLSWTAGDAGRLRIVHHLRAAGFPASSLTDPAPPYRQLHALPACRYAEVLDWWAQLHQWRAKPAWLHVAVKATPIRSSHKR